MALILILILNVIVRALVIEHVTNAMVKKRVLCDQALTPCGQQNHYYLSVCYLLSSKFEFHLSRIGSVVHNHLQVPHVAHNQLFSLPND
jgi:hypothetical protein